MFIEDLLCTGRKNVSLYLCIPFFLPKVFYFCVFGIVLFCILQNLSYWHKFFFSLPLHVLDFWRVSCNQKEKEWWEGCLEFSQCSLARCQGSMSAHHAGLHSGGPPWLRLYKFILHCASTSAAKAVCRICLPGGLQKDNKVPISVMVSVQYCWLEGTG